MSEWPIVSTLIFFPLIGVFIIAFINNQTEIDQTNIRKIGFLTSLFVFCFASFSYCCLDFKNSDFQLQEQLLWLGNGLSYHIGLDGISIIFILLTALLIPLCMLCINGKYLKTYMICFLLLETMLLGAFSSLNALLFYLFFEGSLIPIFIMIGVSGTKEAIRASYKFFLYNFFASVFMLVALAVIYNVVHSLDIIDLLKYHFTANLQYWLWIGFFLAFAVKLPIWPLHTLLRDVYVEAPAPCSAILSGIVLKLAGYGFLRFSLPMFPLATMHFSALLMLLSMVAIIYTSIVALVQTDIKRLFAYASVAHMGYVTLGLFALDKISVNGAIFQMVSHGLIACALFLGVAMLYDRTSSKDISSYGGLANNMPLYAVLFLLFTMANIGLPGTSGFIGEFTTLIGAFKVNSFCVILATAGVVLSACYALHLYKRVAFGKLPEHLSNIQDLFLREKITLFPLAMLVLLLGIKPMLVINTISSSVDMVIAKFH